MKPFLLYILLLSFVFSCSDPTPAGNQQLSSKPEATALKVLYDQMTKASVKSIKLTDNKISIGDTSISLKMDVEFEGQKSNQFIYAANFTTHFYAGKETVISFGSIGIGNNKEEALNVCLEEWYAGFGIPLISLIKNKGVIIDGLQIYSGLMGIRGKLPAGSWPTGDSSMAQKLIPHMKPLLPQDSNDIIPVDIRIMIGPGGIISGECRIENMVSPALLDALKQIDWPASDTGFMLKQFYLIKRIPG